MRGAFGASPLYEPESFRLKFLEKMPKKLSEEEMFHILGSISRYGGGPSSISSQYKRVERNELEKEFIDRMNRRCVKDSGGTSCKFVAQKRWFEMNEVGFTLKLVQSSNGYDDVVVTPYSKWW